MKKEKRKEGEGEGEGEERGVSCVRELTYSFTLHDRVAAKIGHRSNRENRQPSQIPNPKPN